MGLNAEKTTDAYAACSYVVDHPDRHDAARSPKALKSSTVLHPTACARAAFSGK
jgi:hypothetical protein